MPTLEVNGASLYYEAKGAGATIVFVHGIPTDYRAWAAQSGPFTRDRKMVALSRRYAFPNKREGDMTDSTVQNNAEDLRAIVESLGAGPVDLVGHSYGGFISAFLSAEHPGLVNSLVLVEPAVSTLLVADQTSSSQLLALLFRSPSVALSARRFQTRSLMPSLKALDAGDLQRAVELNVDGVQDFTGAFARLPDDVRRMMLDNARTIAELKTSFPRFTSAEAGKIAAPTLILNGEGSTPWLRRIGRLLGKAIPKAQNATIRGASHFPHFENPLEFNASVQDFLRSAR